MPACGFGRTSPGAPCHERRVPAQGRPSAGADDRNALRCTAGGGVAAGPHGVGRAPAQREGPARVSSHERGKDRRLRRGLARDDAAGAQVQSTTGRVDDAQRLARRPAAPRCEGRPPRPVWRRWRRSGKAPHWTSSARASARCTGAPWPTPNDSTAPRRAETTAVETGPFARRPRSARAWRYDEAASATTTPMSCTPYPAASVGASTWRLFRPLTVALWLVAVLAGGCTSLPEKVDRPPSKAQARRSRPRSGGLRRTPPPTPNSAASD